MPKRVLCKFFAHGSCLKGDHCQFSHDWKDQQNNVCTSYQKGIRSHGSRCRFEPVKVSQSHSSRPSSSVNSSQFSASSSSALVWRPTSRSHSSDTADNGKSKSTDTAVDSICSFAGVDSCPRAEKFPVRQGELCLCPSCGKHCLPNEREGHLKVCEKKKKHLVALKHSQEIECSICLERVLSKPKAAERKFGLLSDCDHPFCISCIRNWRSSSPISGMDVNSTLRACPVCRKVSHFVVPSVIWFSTKEEKQGIVDDYRSKLRSIDCKHFDFGNDTCPFGTSCFYRHTVKPGSHLWNSTLMPDMHSSRFLDMDAIEEYSSRSPDEADMDGDHVLFNYLYYKPSFPVAELEDYHTDEDYEDYDDYTIDEEDEGDNLAMAYLLMEAQAWFGKDL